jgi:MSHA biogenesis protein MshQ
MATLDLQVSASADDAHAGSINNDSGRTVTSGATILTSEVNGAHDLTGTLFSPGSHGGNNEASAAARFLNVTVAQGTTITSATFTIRSAATYSSGGTISYLVSAHANDNAPALTLNDASGGSLRSSGSVAPMLDRPRTTAVSAAWNQNSTVAETEYSIDVTAVVQEIVNRAGWASGNAILMIVDTNTTTTQGEWQDYYSYDGSTTKAPKLQIVTSTGVLTADIFCYPGE